MFLVHQSSRIEVPVRTLGAAGDASVFRAAEIVNNLPVWLVHVLPRSTAAEDSPPRWRRLLVHDLAEALTFVELDHWQTARLYALLPEYLTGKDRLILAQCRSIHLCDEPDGNGPCWRIDTEEGMVLWSLYGTAPDNEAPGRLMWQADGLAA